MRPSLLILLLAAAPAFGADPPPTATSAVEIAAPGSQTARDSSIHECVGADGSRVYSDEPCTSKEAVRAQRSRAEGLDAKDDWICTEAGPSAFELLEEKRLPDLPKPQRDALASELFVTLRGDGQTRLGPLGSAHVCTRGREVKVDPHGRILVKRGELVKYMNDPATPAALADRCGTLLERCGGLDPGPSLRNCIEETPACEVSPPWLQADACCPRECLIAFRNATRGGAPIDDAVKLVFGPQGCM